MKATLVSTKYKVIKLCVVIGLQKILCLYYGNNFIEREATTWLPCKVHIKICFREQYMFNGYVLFHITFVNSVLNLRLP
jgi:hypothetical protein